MIAQEQNIKNFLSSQGPIFFVTPNPMRAIGLEKWLPDFHIIYSQNSSGVNLLRKEGVKMLHISQTTQCSAGQLLRNSEVLGYIHRHSQGGRANIMTFKPSPMIAKVCEDNDFNYLGNDWRLNRKWENKVLFANITNSLGVANAFSRVIKLTPDLKYSDLNLQPECSYVLQLARGFSGNSSFLFNSETQYQEIVANHLGKYIKLAQFIVGNSYTLDACITDSGFYWSFPIFQITGFVDFNQHVLGTCGNDYAYATTDITAVALGKIEQSVQLVLTQMQLDGYRGVLGFDFVVSDNEAHLIEVNPRFVGSIPVFTKLQLAVSEIPFLLLHILSFLGFDIDSLGVKNNKKQFNFSQIILRNQTNCGKVVQKIPKSGIYSICNDRLQFIQEVYYIDHKLSTDYFFLQTVDVGSFIGVDMEYANIQFSYGIMKDRDCFVTTFNNLKEIVFNEIILD